MKQLFIEIEGHKYPCRLQMGAMLLFKQETGKDVSKIDSTDITDMLTFIYCMTKSASHADKIEFNYTLEEFANNLTQEEFEKAIKSAESDSKKKKVGK